MRRARSKEREAEIRQAGLIEALRAGNTLGNAETHPIDGGEESYDTAVYRLSARAAISRARVNASTSPGP
jgi:hypothetical protein